MISAEGSFPAGGIAGRTGAVVFTAIEGFQMGFLIVQSTNIDGFGSVAVGGAMDPDFCFMDGIRVHGITSVGAILVDIILNADQPSNLIPSRQFRYSIEVLGSDIAFIKGVV